jgi:hypothetical protein
MSSALFSNNSSDKVFRISVREESNDIYAFYLSSYFCIEDDSEYKFSFVELNLFFSDFVRKMFLGYLISFLG